MTQPCRDWPSGTRVRCVDNGSVSWALTVGRSYTVKIITESGFVHLFEDDEGPNPFGYIRKRFKPVVRVPMGRRVIKVDRLAPQTDAQYIREWCA